MRFSQQFRAASKEMDDGGLRLGAISVGSAPQFDSYAKIMPRPCDWYYPKPDCLGRELRWHRWPMGPTLGSPCASIPKSRLRGVFITEMCWCTCVRPRDLHGILRAGIREQGEIDCWLRADVARTAATEAQAEATRVEKDLK